MEQKEKAFTDIPYFCVKALETGVNIIGVTRGEATKINHTEKLDRNEVFLAQFTEHTAGIKVRGKAKIYTSYGVIYSGEDERNG